MPEGQIDRIVREAGIPNLVEVLSMGLAATDLQSLLLEVYRRRAAQLSPPELLVRFEQDRFTRPAPLDPAAVTRFEQVVWSALPEGYQGLELSPVCPLGTSSAVATVDQHKVLTTVRNSEVVADSTNVLALECALRRRLLLSDPDTRFTPVMLAASQRQVRGQLFGDPRSSAHFRLVGLAAGGRDRGSLAFETEAMRDQIAFFITLIRRARPDWGIRVALTDLSGHEEIWEREVMAVVAGRFPQATVDMDADRSSGRGYYVDASFKVFAVAPSDGEQIELADGGCTTWTRQLLSDSKERLVIAGLGVERLLA